MGSSARDGLQSRGGWTRTRVTGPGAGGAEGPFPGEEEAWLRGGEETITYTV